MLAGARRRVARVCRIRVVMVRMSRMAAGRPTEARSGVRVTAGALTVTAPELVKTDRSSALAVRDGRTRAQAVLAMMAATMAGMVSVRASLELCGTPITVSLARVRSRSAAPSARPRIRLSRANAAAQ